MKKFLLLVCLFVLANLSVGKSFANDGSSGCGLGWMVFKDNSLVSSSLRATTNAIFLNTIAMTVGTSGCAKHSIVQNEQKAIHYAEANFQNLILEMSQGKGEVVDSFATVLGCADKAALRQGLKRHMSDFIQADVQNGVNLFHKVENAVLSDVSLTQACSII